MSRDLQPPTASQNRTDQAVSDVAFTTLPKVQEVVRHAWNKWIIHTALMGSLTCIDIAMLAETILLPRSTVQYRSHATHCCYAADFRALQRQKVAERRAAATAKEAEQAARRAKTYGRILFRGYLIVLGFRETKRTTTHFRGPLKNDIPTHTYKVRE